MRGQGRLRRMTRGWDFLSTDFSDTWIKLSDMKPSHPIEVTEYACVWNIDREPAFAWWVPYTLIKCEVVLSSMNMRIRGKTHKYGVKIPTNVLHAYRIDEKNGNTLCTDSLQKEMYNVRVAFEVLEEGSQVPKGWNTVTGYLVWDVKMNFTHKARCILDGHKTQDPVCA